MASRRVLDLFAGIGGFTLAYHAVGWETAAFCEIDPYCRRVLAHHFPGVPLYDDVRTLSAARLAADGIGPIDVIVGGVPCQPSSAAGKRLGSADERWLWPDFLRLVRELRVRYAIAENPRGLLSIDAGRGFRGILRELAAMGCDALWGTWSAADVGAPHRRDRVFILARRIDLGVGQADADRAQRGEATKGWPESNGHDAGGDQAAGGPPALCTAGGAGAVGDAASARRCAWTGAAGGPLRDGARGPQPERRSGAVGARDVAHAHCRRRQERAQRDGAAQGRQPPPLWDDPGGCDDTASGAVALGEGHRWQQGRAQSGGEQRRSHAAERGGASAAGDGQAIACCQRLQERDGCAAEGGPRSAPVLSGPGTVESSVGLFAHGAPAGLSQHPAAAFPGWPARPGCPQEAYEPPRLARGVPERVAALKALGNAVVWLQAVPLFAAIAEQEQDEEERDD